MKLKIRIAAPAVDDAANIEVIRFLKKRLRIPSSRIQFIRGHTSRAKDILIQGLSIEDVRAKLGSS